MKMNETVKGRLRPLVCIWLAVIMLIGMCAVPASAATMGIRTFVYIGDEALADGMELTAQNAVEFTLEGDVPFNEQEGIMDAVDAPEGYTLRGWNLWNADQSSDLEIYGDEPEMIVATDFSLPSVILEAGDGVIVFEPIFEKYWIEKQPTAVDPSVEVNTPEDVKTYQWYTFDVESNEYTLIGQHDEADPDTEMNAQEVYDGRYTEGSGWATASGNLDVEIAVGAKDVVTVVVPDDFSGHVYDYGTGKDLVTADNKTYTYTAKEDGIFNLHMQTENWQVNFEDIAITVTDNIYTPKKADGQIAKVYTGESNQPVVCEITMKDDSVLTSDTVELNDYWFTKQPTTADPSVEVNAPEDVAGYQWYTYEESVVTRTLVEEVEDEEKEFSVLLTDEDDPMVYGTYADGYWSGMDESDPDGEESMFTFYAVFAAAYGDTVKVKFDGECNGVITDMVNMTFFTKQEDGSYALTLTEENYPRLNEGFYLMIYTVDENFKAEITLHTPVTNTEKVDGQTAKAFTGAAGTYICRATFDDVSIDSNPVDVVIPGKFKDVTPSTNYGGAKFDNTLAELEAAVPLTDDEKAAYKAGADVAVALNVVKADGISDADKALIEAVVDGKIVGMHLDITMTKKVGDADAVKLTELNEAVTVTLTVPAELLKDDRTYTVVRVHDGKAEILETAFDAQANTLTFETDRFSAYALIYKDAGNGIAGSGGEQSKPLDGTNTGDSFNAPLWITLAVAAGAALVVTGIVAKKKA